MNAIAEQRAELLPAALGEVVGQLAGYCPANTYSRLILTCTGDSVV